MLAIPCAVVRGGTTKGIFMLDENLPTDQKQRDRMLLTLMGSPDPRQIDGLGGADPLTSKVAIVSRSSREGIDVEYESVEVGIAEAHVNHGLMCGNLIAGVGYFAIAEGLVKAQPPVTTISIYCRSNRQTIVARVPVVASNPMLPAMPEKNSLVSLVFHNPAGAITGQLLPVGEPLSLLALDGTKIIEVSIVDAGTLYAFVRAADLGLSGKESPATLEGDSRFRSTIELLRARVADFVRECGGTGVSAITSRLVKVAIVGPPDPGQDKVDIVATVINTAKVHKAYAVSGGICLAAAAAIPGTLVNEIGHPQGSPFQLRIGHPSGVLSLRTHWSTGASGTVIHAAEIERSARIILRGTAYVFPEAETVPAVAATDSVDVHQATTPADCLEAVES